MSTLKEAEGKRTGSRKRAQAAALDKMIRGFEVKAEKVDVKLTVAEYIRMVQLREEMQAEEPKEIRITWVEPTEKEPATET
jgi:hypothetical protein